MPRTYEHETAITVDHDEKTCRVDTSVRGVAAKLLRRGFVEVTKPNSTPYRRFLGQARQISFLGSQKRLGGSTNLRKKMDSSGCSDDVGAFLEKS